MKINKVITIMIKHQFDFSSLNTRINEWNEQGWTVKQVICIDDTYAKLLLEREKEE